jgi:hypothetical protein
MMPAGRAQFPETIHFLTLFRSQFSTTSCKDVLRNSGCCDWLAKFPLFPEMDGVIPALRVGSRKVIQSSSSSFRPLYSSVLAMSTFQPGTRPSKGYVDPTPMPEDVPKVAELGVTSAPLKSAAFFIGAYCKEFNGVPWL